MIIIIIINGPGYDKRYLMGSGLKAPAEPSCRVPTYIVYFFKFILGEDFS